MKNRVYLKIRIISLLFVSLLYGCEEMMSVENDYLLDADEHYSVSEEVYGAFVGVVASFNSAAEQLVLLAELKGDLIEPYYAASEEYWQVFRYNTTIDGTIGSPEKFYDIVLNVNDFLKRVAKYHAEHPNDIPESTYKGMISQAINYKVWSLMTIAQFWGEVQLYNDNFQTPNDQAIVKLELDHLPEFLIGYMQEGVNGVDAFQTLNWTEILDNNTLDWSVSSLSANILMGELNLWAGHYQTALDYFTKSLLENTKTPRIISASFGTIFSVSSLPQELISMALFNANYHQTNELYNKFIRDLTLIVTPKTIDLFQAQLRSGYSEGDVVRIDASCYRQGVDMENREIYSVRKYLGNDANIPIYRSGQIYLNMAEALTYMGRFNEAIGLIDRGLQKYFEGSAFKEPFVGYPTDLKASSGLRHRANLMEWRLNEVFEGVVSRQDSIRTVMELLADEVVLELAFEGKRWPTLMRMARNLKDPAFLADRVVTKFDIAEQPAFRALLMDPKNWYIKDEKNNTLKEYR